MHRKCLKITILFGSIILSLFLTPHKALCEYVEGVDTTDGNGYSRDSSFRVGYWQNDMVYYSVNGESTGYFNYSFDDIKKVPDSIDKSGWTIFSTANCFIIKKKDSTYSKFQIISKLADGRYIFKNGSNDTPKDRLLIKSDYNRSIRYKPNNFHILYEYSYNLPPNPYIQIGSRNTCTWEPPIPNNNHLLGYIYFRAKANAVIDTNKSIDMAQWDSVAFIDSTKYIFYGQPLQYFNMVAVYTEGKSEFLSGWSKRKVLDVGVKPVTFRPKMNLNGIEVINTSAGYYCNCDQLQNRNGLLIFSIHTISGRRVATFSNISGNRLFWYPSQRNLPEGVYVIKVEFPDRSVINQSFMFTR